MVFSFTRAQNGDLERALERARRLLCACSSTTIARAPRAAAVTVFMYLRARDAEAAIEETERGMAEFQVVSRAPMRVVALGRSGVGKSHVLNQLLRELGARGLAPPSAREEARMTTRWPAESLTVSSVVAHDERAEEEAADHLRAVEDGDGRGRDGVGGGRGARAPPPPMDAPDERWRCTSLDTCADRRYEGMRPLRFPMRTRFGRKN